MNIQERIEALETEFAEKIKVLKAEAQQVDEFPQYGDEFPQYGDEYHYIEASGRVEWIQYDESGFDLRAQEIGNVYKTKEQAEFVVEKLKVEAELRKFSRPFEEDANNFFIVFNTKVVSLNIWYREHNKSQGAIYFESAEKAQQAIEAVGEDRIKKYIFGEED